MTGGLLHFEFLTISLPPEGSSRDCETPSFALSYVWGPETDKVCIQIDGQDMHITRNLFSALRSFRHELNQLPIWVDAACIQQWPRVDQEKKGQLERIGDVYCHATRVLVYLGELDSQTDVAFGHIQRKGDLARWPNFDQCEDQQGKIAIREALELMMNAVNGSLLHGPSIPTKHILELFNRPWFFRAWIIQEVVLARNEPSSVIFACGETHRIQWEHLWGAYFILTAWLMREGRRVESARGLPARLFHYGAFVRRVGTKQMSFDPRVATTMGIQKNYLQRTLSPMKYVG
ncbi:HET domain-containing protein [Fusarium sp. LHS14.1]|nr:HET domain-containing protein [Fusarium sp. LHS14.1]